MVGCSQRCCHSISYPVLNFYPMPQSKIYAGLEIGTSKTCIVVCEVRPDASATIIGVGCVPSAGVRKGEIINPSMARQCVRDALDLAQERADADIVRVYLSVTGDHIYGQTNTGSFRLPDDETIIDESHVNAAREKACNIDLSPDRFPFNSEQGGYSIDGREPTRYPEGLTGRTVDVNCHVIHGTSTRLQNSLHCVREVPLEVENMVFAPLAAAQVVLTRQQREAGALLIDIGAGTADFICFKGGDIIASGCVPAGGNTINQDIVTLTGGRVSNEAAEALKCTEGNVMGNLNDRSIAQYRTDIGLHDAAIPRGELNRIIRERMEDILLHVRDKIPAELLRNKGINVYFSGGTSVMRGLEELAEGIFGCNVYQPVPPRESEHNSYLANPRFCTAIGLIRYAQKFEDDADRRQKSSSFFSWLRSIFLFGNS